jgi:hypothetical protein
MAEKLKWKKIADDKYRSEVGTILRRVRGWFFYARGHRKADGGPFSSFAKAKQHAAAF